MSDFLMQLYMDMPSINYQDKQTLLDCFREKYPNYSDPEFCLFASDLIARQYDRNIAVEFFRQVFPKSTAVGKKGVTLGLDVIGRRAEADPTLGEQIAQILASG